MKTAIIILNYNNTLDTVKCVRSIERYNSAPIKYIVVDNGSTNKDGINPLSDYLSSNNIHFTTFTEADVIPAELPFFTILKSDTNDGYAVGNNKGLNLAYADDSIDNILILNNDILFTEDIIPAFLEVQRSNPNCGILSPLLISKDGGIDYCCARRAPTNWEIILPFLLFRRDFFHILSTISNKQKILLSNPKLLKSEIIPIGMPSGSCMFISKSVFKAIDSFDPHTFLYYEENILGKKLSNCALVNYCLPQIKCTHLGAGSTRLIKSVILQQCNLNSANYYLLNYGNLTVPQALVWRLTVTLWKLKFHFFDSKS